MKSSFFVIMAVILSAFITACGGSGGIAGSNGSGGSSTESDRISDSTGVKKISPEDAMERLKNDEEIILLDVRTQEEYEQEHIPGSMLIPVDVIEDEAPVQLKDKDAVIFIYCRSGRRSAIAADTLAEMGYKNVYDLGGIIDWPYATESGS